MKLHLSVFYEDYAQDIEALRDRVGSVIDPDVFFEGADFAEDSTRFRKLLTR